MEIYKNYMNCGRRISNELAIFGNFFALIYQMNNIEVNIMNQVSIHNPLIIDFELLLCNCIKQTNISAQIILNNFLHSVLFELNFFQPVIFCTKKFLS